MNELKPCPFCGGEPTITYDGHGKWFFIECINDDCPFIVQGAWHLDMKNATEEWNNRAETEEHKFTRQFIHEHGLEFELASAWDRRKKDG